MFWSLLNKVEIFGVDVRVCWLMNYSGPECGQ